MAAPSVRVVVALQTRPRFGAVEENLAAAEAMLAGRRPDLLVLPELFATGYAFQDMAEVAACAETMTEGPTVAWLRATSARTGGVVVGGYVERVEDRLYNAALACAAGRVLASYRKVHLFGFEREVFERGRGPFPVVEHADLRVGLMICFDWRFPEAARGLALAEADVIAHPSALVTTLCPAAMVTRALENGVYAVTAGRVGAEHRPPRPALRFTGGSRVVAPSGEVLADARGDEPGVVEATIDVAKARDKRLPSGNDLFLDRRPSAYRT